jgi:hypothetical protein
MMRYSFTGMREYAIDANQVARRRTVSDELTGIDAVTETGPAKHH